jgi:hypothetical protein
MRRVGHAAWVRRQMYTGGKAEGKDCWEDLGVDGVKY